MRTTLKTLQLVLCLQLAFLAAFSQQVAKQIPNALSPDGRIGFLEFKPKDYGTQLHPLIIFLHGIGERGNGASQIYSVANNGIPLLCSQGATMKFTVGGQTSSFVVLSPQLSASYGYWPGYYANEMIKYAKANLQIDPNRIYLTGLSLGGGGVWGNITDTWDPSFDAGIAAAAPVCGTGQGTDAGICSNIGANHLPVWAFHSMDDGTVSVATSQHYEQLAISCPLSPAAKFTYYQTGNHAGAWVNAYDTGHITRTVNVGGSQTSFTANPNLYEWFLGFSRASNTPPTASAGTAQTVTLPSSSVTLTGTGAGTSGASVASYAWAKTSGPAGASISTAGAPATTVTGLTQGVYVFTLTVTDNHGLTATSAVTITVVAAPVAVAGPSQTISATSTVLDAAASYSPNGSITSYSWQQIGGPAVVLVNANSVTPLVNNMILGNSYSFRVTVTDVAGASGSAVTGVTVLGSLLPVEFTFFSGEHSNAGNLLKWATANEQNNGYFSVERSQDGSQFAAVGRVNSAGAGNTATAYSYTDAKAPAANCYYRLKQVDKDGQFTYSKTILVAGSSNAGAVQVYPSPAQSAVSVVISNDVRGNGKIALYDIAGHNVRQQTVVKSNNLLQAAVNVNDLVPGLYLVEIKIGDTYKFTKTILKQ